MLCKECGTTGIKITDKFCYHCGSKCKEEAKCSRCSSILNTDAKFCSDCGLSTVNESVQPIRKKQKAKEDSYKSEHGPSARMFHPHNGRHNFEPSSSNIDLRNIKVSITPRILKEMEIWKSQNPHASELEMQKEFGF